MRLMLVLFLCAMLPLVIHAVPLPRSPTTPPATNGTAANLPLANGTAAASNGTSSPLVQAFKEGFALGNRTGHELGETAGFGRGVAVGEVVGKGEAERQFALTEWKTAHLVGIFVAGISFTIFACCLACCYCCCPCFCAAMDPNFNGPYMQVYLSSSPEPLKEAGKFISVFPPPPRRCAKHAH
ncbi:hypothetical protein M3Y99_01623100 [Aphelenchoides fujianensis]|nr:hypothetical protein M3Y99_01623100 [Aphelenchoides fujianensis]